MNTRLVSVFIITFFLISCNPSTEQNPGKVNADNSFVTADTTALLLPKSDSVNHPDAYTLNKINTENSKITFRATGTEPFWLLEIDFQKFIHFKLMDGLDITTLVSEGVKAADANVIRYRAFAGDDELIVQIIKKECINDMSGKKSDYSVTVDIKKKADKNYTTYKGCGDYLKL